MNKNRNIIINIRSNYNKKNKFEKKFNNTPKRNGPAKRNNNHINNFIINIFPNKSVYPEPSIVCQKIIKDMNLTSSLMQTINKTINPTKQSCTIYENIANGIPLSFVKMV